MKQYILLSFFTVSVLLAKAQQLPAADSTQIVSHIQDWDESWNVKDYLLGAKWYAADADFTNAFGDKRKGKAAIESLLKEVFSLNFVMSGKSGTVEQSFRYLPDNTVIVRSEIERRGQAMPDGSPMPVRKTSHQRVFVKKEGAWLIVSHLISDARDKGAAKH